MARKATHTGICQACGRRQMLPGGVLADHGYEIRDGWRSGPCMGTGHLPFEISKDLIDATIRGALEEGERLEALAAEWAARRISADDLECWRKIYHRELSNRTRGAVYLWTEGRIDLVDGVLTFFPSNGRDPERVHSMGTPMAKAFEARQGYAKWLRARSDEQRAYAEHQAQRVVGWVPRELTPREGVAA